MNIIRRPPSSVSQVSAPGGDRRRLAASRRAARGASGRRARRPAPAPRPAPRAAPPPSAPLEVGDACSPTAKGPTQRQSSGVTGRPAAQRSWAYSCRIRASSGLARSSRPWIGASATADEERLQHHVVPAVLVEMVPRIRVAVRDRLEDRPHVRAQPLADLEARGSRAPDRAAGRGRARRARPHRRCGGGRLKRLGERPRPARAIRSARTRAAPSMLQPARVPARPRRLRGGEVRGGQRRGRPCRAGAARDRRKMCRSRSGAPRASRVSCPSTQAPAVARLAPDPARSRLLPARSPVLPHDLPPTRLWLDLCRARPVARRPDAAACASPRGDGSSRMQRNPGHPRRRARARAASARTRPTSRGSRPAAGMRPLAHRDCRR